MAFEGGTSYNFDTGVITDGFAPTNSGSSSSGGMDWGSMIGPAFDMMGGMFGSKADKQASQSMAETYGAIAKDARVDAGEASFRADPFATYRPAAADHLAGIFSGEKDFRADPGYKFRMDEAMRETERGAAARGFNRSGNVMAAMNQRAQDVASTEYGSIIDRLSGLAGATPQNAIAGGQTYGNMMSNVYGARTSGGANQAQVASSDSNMMSGMMGPMGDMLGGMF